jgi:hypothetical protein
MRRRGSNGLGWVGLALLLVSCGIAPSGVMVGDEAPTGVAEGMTLYVVDAHGELVPQLRESDRLGSIGDAVSLLLADPIGTGLHSGIASTDVTRVEVTVTDDIIRLRLPLPARDVTPLGADQIVCTALAAHVQRGGSTGTRVEVVFTHPEGGPDRPRTCPLIG